MAMSVVYGTMNGRVVYENRSGVESSYMRDPLGNTIGLLDMSGNQTDSWTYWPYGELQNHTGSSTTPLTFLGTLGYFVDFLNMMYVRARHLKADLTTWMTVDPYWPWQRQYQYAGARPAEAVDPMGLFVQCLGAAICLGALAGVVLGCLLSPAGFLCCLSTLLASNPALAVLIFEVCAIAITICIGVPLPVPPPIFAPAAVPAFAAALSAGGNPNCETSCDLQRDICKSKGNNGVPPCGRWYEPYCDNCYAQCVSSGAWPASTPCDYWNWNNDGYDPR